MHTCAQPARTSQASSLFCLLAVSQAVWEPRACTRSISCVHGCKRPDHPATLSGIPACGMWWPRRTSGKVGVGFTEGCSPRWPRFVRFNHARSRSNRILSRLPGGARSIYIICCVRTYQTEVRFRQICISFGSIDAPSHHPDLAYRFRKLSLSHCFAFRHSNG